MTEVSFHSRVEDPIAYACRLLRKAVRKGSTLAVTAAPERLRELDRVLWTFDPLEFLPHRRVAADAVPAPRFDATPLWLVDPGAPYPTHDVLVNLGDEVPPGFESFGRVIEIVAGDDAAVQSGRRRWRHYAERGYAPAHHEVAAA